MKDLAKPTKRLRAEICSADKERSVYQKQWYPAG
jgi:hypothetical protein